MRLTIEHHTQYVYTHSVKYAIQQLRLTPRNSAAQSVKDWQIKTSGQPLAFEDAYGNCAHTLVIDQPHDRLLISVCGDVETGVYTQALPETLPIQIYLRASPLAQADAAIMAFARRYGSQSPVALMHALRDHMQYVQGVTSVQTSAAEAFAAGAGVCQDFAHIFIACCRALNLPARYISGYLFTADASQVQTHAWVEVWHENVWIGLDVTNGTPVGEAHIKLACGLDYASASPLSGSRMGGGEEGMASLVHFNQKAASTIEHSQQTLRQLLQQAQIVQQ